MPSWSILLGAAGLAALGPGVASAQFRGRAELVAVSAAGVQADASAAQPSVSADGRYVAFASEASNLVPLDTNLNKDVFVHDTRTGATERVSVTWQGQEARDDSDSPSISADGRWVAFRSRAWNMYPGGANLGQPTWQIYLHDREGPSTIRVTVPVGGGDPDFASENPAISADGDWVVFESSATNLVGDDRRGFRDIFLFDRREGSVSRVSVADAGGNANHHSNHPAISADGSVVVFESRATNLLPPGVAVPAFARTAIYARDLVRGTNELVSAALGHPFVAPDGPSQEATLSGDGRFVAFSSMAQNLTDDTLNPFQAIYVRDRHEGTTTLATPKRLVAGPCGAPSAPQPCFDGSSVHAPLLSLDGRFLSFLSSSWELLPANPLVHREQILLLDRATGRLRRLSVDGTGTAVGYVCGGGRDPIAMSANGLVFVHQHEDIAALGFADANGPQEQDVLRLDWTCDDRGKCRSLSLCPAAPAACEPAERSRLEVRRRPPGGSRLDHFYWRWSGRPEDAGRPFVDPTDDGHYSLCLYGGSPTAVEFDAGLLPEDGWRARRTSYRRDRDDDPIAVVQLRRGQARSAIVVKGAGPALDLPYLPIAAPLGIAVQLHESTTGRCWGAHFPTAAIAANFAGTPAPGPATQGQLRARID